MHVLLIGPRGCGKTSIGRAVADALGLRFVDLDDLVMRRFTEPTVSAIWQAHGEPAWRRAELAVLREVLDAEPADRRSVIALGGGTPVIPEARDLIEAGRRAGRLAVVYLRCEARVLERRLRERPGDRPSLTGRDAATEIASILAGREPDYLALADRVYEGGRDGSDERRAADEVAALIRGLIAAG